jgi:hypothetical protein
MELNVGLNGNTEDWKKMQEKAKEEISMKAYVASDMTFC